MDAFKILHPERLFYKFHVTAYGKDTVILSALEKFNVITDIGKGHFTHLIV